jgi:hypothetical protein
MNSSDHELGKNIARHLDEGLARMDEGTRMRLLAARKVALSHYREQAAVGVWAWAGHAVERVAGHHPHALRYTAGAVALIIALIGITYWQANSAPAIDLADIDAKILTGELPINAYLDKGFDSWLKRSSR